MEPILRVQNLTKTFTRSGQSNLTAVNGISFDLLPGECLGIIGESGSGKTTVGGLLARQLGLPFRDCDPQVERLAGRTVAQLFSGGEECFRRWETAALQALCAGEDCVLATGGESDHAASGCDRRKDFSGWRGHYAENGKITPHDLSENADGFPDTDRFL